MGKDFSRRNFVALTGASFAIAACSNARQPDAPPDKKPTDIRGYPENYGDNPNIARAGDFPVNYIGIIDIRARGGWKIAINHAAFPSTDLGGKPLSEDAKLEKAIRIIQAKGANGRFRDLKGDLAPCPRSGGVLDGDNFDGRLGFKSKNELFIFIEGQGVELTQGALLSFTPLGSDLKPRDPNYSFYNASSVDPATLAAAKLSGRMIRVRNYMQDKNGKPIGSNHQTKSQRYSMNIHFTVPGEGGTAIPMIIDPDTGNGQGSEP